MCLYVRELTLAEGRRLTRVLKTTKTAAYLRRAQVVAFSGQGMRARAIAGRLYLHEEYVRALIRRFNAGGFAALRPRKASGRPSQVCAGRGQRHPGGRGHAAARPGPAVHRVVPPETGGPSGCAAGWSRSCMPPRSAASCATRASRSNARRPGRRAPIRTSPPKKTRLCALPGGTAERPGDLFRRVRAHRSAPVSWARVAPGPAPGAAARDVSAAPWHAPIPRGLRRRSRSAHDALLPAQALSRSAAVPLRTFARATRSPRASTSCSTTSRRTSDAR